ncbi:MAG: hypothetical protein ACLQBB_12720 [Solirubrobacteraceae bacterium]
MSAAAAGAQDAGAGEGGGRVDPLASAVFAALVVACFLAFFITQRLKHTPTAVQQFDLTPYFSPTPTGHHRQEQISFKLAHAETVTVSVIDSSGDTVATLLRRRPVPRYKRLSLRWNGRRGTALTYTTQTTANGHPYLLPDNTGRPAPAGEYRVRLDLSGQPSPVLSPHSFTLVRR